MIELFYHLVENNHLRKKKARKKHIFPFSRLFSTACIRRMVYKMVATERHSNVTGEFDCNTKSHQNTAIAKILHGLNLQQRD